MRKNGVDGVSIRTAALRMKKAPPTVRLMLERGEAEGFTVSTEAGQSRQYVSLAWLERWEAEQAIPVEPTDAAA